MGGKREVTIDTRTIIDHGEFNRFESQGVANNHRFDGGRRCGQSDHRDSTIKEVHKIQNTKLLGVLITNDSSRFTVCPYYLNETFITALWDTGVEKSFISEEVYCKYFSYRPRQKRKDRVVTAQGTPCCHLGIDFMKQSKLTLDFDQKSLILPDNQIKQLQKIERPVEIDQSDTKLGEGQKQKLRNLFNGFKGLFSDQPGLTHVLYHEIDTVARDR
ncbi:uncharacterized protein TNCV_3442811 [Trichonephila clavipes]|nr:uncharacterized protein TNCV_3442811 [Trichonephila clavipes]